jgi:hypothetical protein
MCAHSEMRVADVYACPVCGSEELRVKPDEMWPPPESGATTPPSFGACPHCGFQFGANDSPGAAPRVSVSEYRAKWVAEGSPRFWPPVAESVVLGRIPLPSGEVCLFDPLDLWDLHERVVATLPPGAGQVLGSFVEESPGSRHGLAALTIATEDELPGAGWTPSRFKDGDKGTFNTDTSVGVFVDLAMSQPLREVLGERLEGLFAHYIAIRTAGHLFLGAPEDPVAVVVSMGAASARCRTCRAGDHDAAISADIRSSLG